MDNFTHIVKGFVLFWSLSYCFSFKLLPVCSSNTALMHSCWRPRDKAPTKKKSQNTLRGTSASREWMFMPLDKIGGFLKHLLDGNTVLQCSSFSLLAWRISGKWEILQNQNCDRWGIFIKITGCDQYFDCWHCIFQVNREEFLLFRQQPHLPRCLCITGMRPASGTDQ